MKVLIIEDEPLSARRLKNMLSALRPDITIAAVISSINDAVKWLEQQTAPDLILMDIELSDGKSFEIFSQVQVSCPIIFITAYDEYALKAFQVNSIDFLVKPVSEEDLLQSLNKLEAMRSLFQKEPISFHSLTDLIGSLQQQLKSKTYRERFLVKVGQRFITIETGDIAYFYSVEKMVALVTFNFKEYILDYSLDELEKMLVPKDFYRANRQFIISPAAIESMHMGFNGKYSLRLHSAQKTELTVSREKAGEFKGWLGA